MRLILNILWFIFGGWIAGFAYFPFGKVVVDRAAGPTSLLLNIVWFIFAGWWLALHHIVLAIGLAVTLIGIPFAWQHVKLALISLTPVGKAVVEV